MIDPGQRHHMIEVIQDLVDVGAAQRMLAEVLRHERTRLIAVPRMTARVQKLSIGLA